MVGSKIIGNQTKLLHNLVSGKKVAVVGNSLSLFDSKYGVEIDSCDVVIRMNKAAIFYEGNFEETHGTRMDVWAFWAIGAFMNKTLIEENTPEKLKEIFFNSVDVLKCQICINGHAKKTLDHCNDTLPYSVYKNLNMSLKQISKIGKPVTPSLGIALLEWLSLQNTKVINVYGFDWKKTPTFSEIDLHKIDMENKYDKRCKHDFAAEEFYFHNVLKHRNMVLKQ